VEIEDSAAVGDQDDIKHIVNKRRKTCRLIRSAYAVAKPE